MKPGLVWCITGAGSRHYVCVVGAAPLQRLAQRHPTVLNSQPGRALNAEWWVWWDVGPVLYLTEACCMGKLRAFASAAGLWWDPIGWDSQ